MATNYFQNQGNALIVHKVYGNVSPVTNNGQHSNHQPRHPETVRINVHNPQHDFVGRSNELAILDREITSPRTPRIAIVCGLGGVGKTQLIRKFIDKNQSTFENIIWIESQQRVSLEDSIRKIAKELNMATESDDFNRVVEKLFNTLSKTRSLIVFDNVDDREHIRFAFTLATCERKLFLIVTSRLREWGDSVCVIPLDVFTFDDAYAFVSNTLNGENKDDIETLIKELQYFPLALRQAKAYINYEKKELNPMFTIADYLNIYNNSNAQRLLNFDIDKTDLSYTYDRTTFTTWDVTIQALKRSGTTGKLALRILDVIAFFNPDRIRRDIFFHLMRDDGDATMKIREAEQNVILAVRLLVDYSMVNRIDCPVYTVQIHRLVQEVLKINLYKTDEGTERTLRVGLGLIAEMIDSNALHECHEHAILVFVFALKFENLVKTFKTVPHQILFSLNEWRKTNVASDFGEKIIKPFTDIIGIDDLDGVLTKHDFGCAYNDLGKHSHALKIFEEVYSAQYRIYGKDNARTILSLKNVASAYQDLGKHKEANEIFHKVYVWRKSNLGETNPETLKSKHGIAFSNRTLGKYAEALQMFQELYAESIAILGESAMETILTAQNMGSLYLELGRHSEALQLYLKVLDRDKNAMAEMKNGDEYASRHLKTTFYIACAYRELGHYSQAIEMFQDVLDKQKSIFCEDHPEIILTEENIATVYLQSGETSEALRRYEDVLNKRNKVYDEDHQMCLITKFNIAETLRRLGKYPEALQILEGVLVKQKNLFEGIHPQIMRTAFYRALVSFELDKRSEMVQPMEQVIDQVRHFLGESHAELLKARFHIATSNRHLGKYPEALGEFLDIYDKQRNLYGDVHPETLKTKFSIGFTYYMMGRYAEALVALQDVFIERKKLFGENNPETISAKSAIATVRSRKYSKELQMLILLLLLPGFIAYGLFLIYTMRLPEK
ncbi:uncharacterized protein LOC119079214 isoform X2 [Bradysia coprophila]|uniref:uncharacterized protein LOC119079214 isoform X2 n=1 Tax=Bradysia coprophila TaxID=38358 RepID=UPI00187D9182|nr:uncharacterized protein LOC119079214 isoform X2 [Bradysia coprophila]